MANYLAVFMHGSRGGEGRYQFEGPDDLLKSTPVRIMRAFMDSVVAKNGIGHVDYEVNAALKNDEHEIATVIGEIEFEHAGTQPFMCMLSRAEGA